MIVSSCDRPINHSFLPKMLRDVRQFGLLGFLKRNTNITKKNTPSLSKNCIRGVNPDSARHCWKPLKHVIDKYNPEGVKKLVNMLSQCQKLETLQDAISTGMLFIDQISPKENVHCVKHLQAEIHFYRSTGCKTSCDIQSQWSIYVTNIECKFGL